MKENIKIEFPSSSSQEIDDIVQGRLKDLELKLRENGLNPNLCDWDKIEKKIRNDTVYSMWNKIATSVGFFANQGISISKELDDIYKHLSNKNKKENDRDMPVENIARNYNFIAQRTITKVIFNNPATIVFFGNDKVVSKCHDEQFDEKKGLLMCIAKAHGCTHSHLKAILKQRGLAGNQDAELCLLYDIAGNYFYGFERIEELVEKYKQKKED